MYNHWIDNRDLRDRNYLGPVIVPYDETNFRHREIRGEESKESALDIIDKILQNDLLSLKNRLESERRFQKDLYNTPEELRFEEFYKPDFYKIVEKEITVNNRKFVLRGEPDALTVPELKKLYNEQSKEFWEEGRPFKFQVNPNTHVTISEILFEPIYREYKKQIGWLHNRSPIKRFKYSSEKALLEAMENCGARIEDVKKLRNNQIV